MQIKKYAVCPFAVFACVALSTTASASTSDIIASNTQAGIQFISTYVDYTETGNGIFGTQTGVLDTESGYVPGFALFASAMWGEPHFYLAGQVSHNNGYTNYTGALMGGGPYGSVVATSGATLMDNSLRFGTGLEIRDSLMATPYAEIGSHEWDRGVNDGETYTHDYWGVGILGQYSPATALVISANAMIGRTYRSYILVAGPFGFSSDLSNSGLYKAGLSVDYAFTADFHGNAGIDYTRFKYGMSSINILGGGAYYVWEPDSSTKYTTFRVGLGYGF
jgi:hypothetical protein